MLWTLAADTVKVIPVPSSLDGVSTALVGFLLLCMAFPTMVRDRRLFLASLGLTIAILGVTTLRYVLISSPAMQVFGGFLVGLLQIALLIGLYLATGGIGIGELAGEVRETFDGSAAAKPPPAAEAAKRPEPAAEAVVKPDAPARPDAALDPDRGDPRRKPPPPGPLPLE